MICEAPAGNAGALWGGSSQKKRVGPSHRPVFYCPAFYWVSLVRVEHEQRLAVDLVVIDQRPGGI